MQFCEQENIQTDRLLFHFLGLFLLTFFCGLSSKRKGQVQRGGTPGKGIGE